MKYSSIKFIVAVSILLSNLGTKAYGQSKVMEAIFAPCDNTIVRHWRGNEYIVYSRTSGGGGTISYHDNASGTTIAALVPSYAIINDFRIANDTIFAGGTYVNYTTSYGLLACLDINDLLAGTGQFNVLIIPVRYLSTNSECGVDYDNQITEVKRLALYEDNGGTRIAFIAENNITIQDSPNSVMYHRVGFGDAAFLSAGYWDLGQYHYNKDGIEEYTDICTTDNKIFISAKTNDSSRFKFQVFKKIKDYASTAYTGYYSDRPGCADHVVESKVMATPIRDDLVAVAYHYIDAAAEGLAYKIIDVSSSNPTLVYSADVSALQVQVAGGDFYDLRCNYANDNIVFLSKMDVAAHGMDSYILIANESIISSGPMVAKHTGLISELQSLDIFENDQFISSGYDGGGYLNVYNDYASGTTYCGESDEIWASETFQDLYSTVRHHCTINSWYDTFPEMYNNNIDVPFTALVEDMASKCEY